MMSAGGFNKLVEEIGEALQDIGKYQAYPTGEHPDGKGPMQQRLENELADVRAAIQFVTDKHGLDLGRMNVRMVEKLKLFKRWDNEKEFPEG